MLFPGLGNMMRRHYGVFCLTAALVSGSVFRRIMNAVEFAQNHAAFVAGGGIKLIPGDGTIANVLLRIAVDRE